MGQLIWATELSAATAAKGGGLFAAKEVTIAKVGVLGASIEKAALAVGGFLTAIPWLP
jgi:hypothetical protein